KGYAVLDVMRPIAEARGCTVAQVAVAWILARPGVTSILLGATKLHQLDDNLGAADLVLGEEQSRVLDEASDPQAADYPYGGPGIGQRSRSLRGGH
ncbi:MAG: aldo/keto reductase, partial [Nocardioidaceae bacterium]